MAVTIKDVAKEANVSISTVSRVINDSKPVSDEIKQRVMEVIRRLGYTPNPIARNLVTKKTQLVGVIVPDIANFYMGEVLNAIEEIAKTYGYDIILCNSYGEIKQEIHYLKLLSSKQVEGIIFLTHELSEEHREFFSGSDMPVVMINRDASDMGIAAVTVNHFDASYEMTQHLINYGHKRIALIRNGSTKDVFGIEQLEGYAAALEEAGIEVDLSLVLEGHFSTELAYEATKNILSMEKLPTAIFATTDAMAIGSINCLVDSGYKVPDDISVVSFYDTELARMYRPQLTTIHQPIYDIGAVAIRLIIKKIRKEELDKLIFTLPHTLVERDSLRRVVEE